MSTDHKKKPFFINDAWQAVLKILKHVLLDIGAFCKRKGESRNTHSNINLQDTIDIKQTKESIVTHPSLAQLFKYKREPKKYKLETQFSSYANIDKMMVHNKVPVLCISPFFHGPLNHKWSNRNNSYIYMKSYHQYLYNAQKRAEKVQNK